MTLNSPLRPPNQLPLDQEGHSHQRPEWPKDWGLGEQRSDLKEKGRRQREAGEVWEAGATSIVSQSEF